MSNNQLMIIHHDPYVRRGMQSVLSCEDMTDWTFPECEHSDDTRAVIDRITLYNPDVVMLNLDYPLRNGAVQLCRQIARTFPRIGLVICSDNPLDDEEELFEVIKTGAAAYIRTKACTRDEMVDAVLRASNGEYPINETVNLKPKLAWRILKEFQEMASQDKPLKEMSAQLTQKELQILTCIAEGRTNKNIGQLLGIGEQTIKNHVSNILRKLNANDRAHAVFLAVQNGLISLEPDMQQKFGCAN